MTWVPISGAVKKLREASRLEQRELAKKAGLSERTIRLLESKRAPKTMYASSVKALAGVFKCAPEELATWVARKRGHDPSDELESLIALPPSGTLSRRAQREQELGRGGEQLGGVELCGPTLLKRISAACALAEGQRFAFAGLVKEYEALPARAAAALEVEVGHGARFLLSRSVARGVPFYATVFTRDVAHTRSLIDHGERKTRAQLIARVVVRPPGGDWKGFFVFEKRPKPHPFAFVVEELLP
jgi:transcriptional regulator with XRE-family HTH domain